MKDDTENDDGVIGPLHVPAKYDPTASLRERVVFALATIGKGNAADVATKLSELGDGEAGVSDVAEVLTALYDKGLVNGSDDADNRQYDLAKVTRPHTGHVAPDAID